MRRQDCCLAAPRRQIFLYLAINPPSTEPQHQISSIHPAVPTYGSNQPEVPVLLVGTGQNFYSVETVVLNANTVRRPSPQIARGLCYLELRHPADRRAASEYSLRRYYCAIAERDNQGTEEKYLNLNLRRERERERMHRILGI